jgi:Zn-dependent M28 family amino/carboxypeptidase
MSPTGQNILLKVEGDQVAEFYFKESQTAKDTIYHGADDNASGTAALLTLAKYFSKNQPSHSIIIRLMIL